MSLVVLLLARRREDPRKCAAITARHSHSTRFAHITDVDSVFGILQIAYTANLVIGFYLIYRQDEIHTNAKRYDKILPRYASRLNASSYFKFGTFDLRSDSKCFHTLWQLSRSSDFVADLLVRVHIKSGAIELIIYRPIWSYVSSIHPTWQAIDHRRIQ